jgi:hypothetical protein
MKVQEIEDIIEKQFGERIYIFETEKQMWYNYVCNSLGYNMTREEFKQQRVNDPETLIEKDMSIFNRFNELKNNGKKWYGEG